MASAARAFQFKDRAAVALHIQERAARSISIVVSPPPVTLSERRSILRLLEKHGPVEYFRAIPGKDASFVSLMRDVATVTKVTASSPHRITVETPKKSTTPANEKRKASAGGFGTLLNVIESRHSFKQENREDVEKEFTVEVTPSPDYRHHLSARATLSKPWPDFVKNQKSFISETLNQSLPDSLATMGLKHWDPDFGAQPSRNADAVARMELRNWTPSKFKLFNGKEEDPAENDELEDAELEDGIEQSTENENSVSQLNETHKQKTNLSSSTGA